MVAHHGLSQGHRTRRTRWTLDLAVGLIVQFSGRIKIKRNQCILRILQNIKKAFILDLAVKVSKEAKRLT
jgi:hypothetical protein